MNPINETNILLSALVANSVVKAVRNPRRNDFANKCRAQNLKTKNNRKRNKIARESRKVNR